MSNTFGAAGYIALDRWLPSRTHIRNRKWRICHKTFSPECKPRVEFPKSSSASGNEQAAPLLLLRKSSTSNNRRITWIKSVFHSDSWYRSYFRRASVPFAVELKIVAYNPASGRLLIAGSEVPEVVGQFSNNFVKWYAKFGQQRKPSAVNPAETRNTAKLAPGVNAAE